LIVICAQISGMDRRQLRCFVTVAEELHFGRAAERLHLAQSAISLQVQKLEAELGVRLLNRGKRAAVSLTSAGGLFLTEAVAALRQLERAERIGRLSGRGEIGQIEVGYVASAVMCGVLPSCLGRFRLARPAVNVRLKPLETPEQLAALSEGVIDVGFVRPRSRYPAGVSTRLVHREPLLLALGADHPLAAERALLPSSVAGETFVIPVSEEAAGFDASVATLQDLGGALRRPARQVSDFVTVLALVSAGYGLALVPRSMQALGVQNVAYRAIDGYSEAAELVLAWRASEVSPAVRAFVAQCLREARGVV
jgi:DNA-binding transcriptional LysR family regulator